MTAAGAGIVVGGVVGMTVDSLLGATLEADRLGNQSINFLAPLAGAVAIGSRWFLMWAGLLL